MAGRPKMMARRVWDLKLRFVELVAEFNRLQPEQYRKDSQRIAGQSDDNDMIRFAWQEAYSSVNSAEFDLEFLADMLYAKAGIPTPQQVEIVRQRSASALPAAGIGSA